MLRHAWFLVVAMALCGHAQALDERVSGVENGAYGQRITGRGGESRRQQRASGREAGGGTAGLSGVGVDVRSARMSGVGNERVTRQASSGRDAPPPKQEKARAPAKAQAGGGPSALRIFGTLTMGAGALLALVGIPLVFYGVGIALIVLGLLIFVVGSVLWMLG